MTLVRDGLACVALLTFTVARLAAQQPEALDIIRGSVIGPDSQPVEAAHITVRAVHGGDSRETLTNEHGTYTVIFPGTPGDYTVTARFIGLAPATVHVVRQGGGRVLTGDLILALANGTRHMLDPVTVTARKRPRPFRTNDASPVDDGVLIGDPDLRGTPDEFGAPFDLRRYSVLGADPSQNALVVNGAEVQAVLPDAVGMRGRLTTTSADASAGGFSGGRLTTMVGASADYHLRYLSASLTPAALEWVDRASGRAGVRRSVLDATLWTSDPLFHGGSHLTSVATYAQSTAPLPKFPTSPAGFARLGLAPDSLARFLDIMSGIGIPLTVAEMPDRQRTTRLAWMGHLNVGGDLDVAKLTLDASLGTTGTGGAFTSPSALPSYGGHSRNSSGFITATFSRYLGNNFLTDFSTTFNVYTTAVAPYLDLPEGRVRVFSALSTGDSALTWLAFGGNPAAGRSRTTTWQARGSTSWLSFDRKQRHRVGGELFAERLWRDPTNGRRGSFEFASLEALAAGEASRFTRYSPAAAQRSSGLRGALYIDNQWTVRPRLTLEYGLRLDADRTAAPAASNPEVDSLFRRRTDVLPRLASLSPRLGVAWTYERADTNRDVFRLPGRMSFSIGRYQSHLGAGTALAAAQATGLASGAQLLDCAGAAVPMPEWARYSDDPVSIPSTCADGSSGIPATPAVPSVSLFDRYRPPAVWRAALTWHNVTWTDFDVTLTRSRGTQRGSAIDLNLQPDPQFTLSAEAGRPVYVAASAIAPGTGTVAFGASRRSALYGPVLDRVSDLHNSVTQLFVNKVFGLGKPVVIAMQYLYQTGREQSRGFGGATAGDPFAVVWSPITEPRHIVSAVTSFNFSPNTRLVARAMLMSGMRYTPLVAGDVNGDGSAVNDIAFIPAPSSPLGRSVVEALSRAPIAARRCVTRQAGRIAARNSCTGPPSGTLDLRLEISPSWLPTGGGIFVDLSNAAGGVDRLLHGTSHAHGWGDMSVADPTLLVATGFDPATRKFTYQMNPRFGQRPGVGAWHNPVELRVSVKMPIGPSLATQQNRAIARRARANRDDDAIGGRVLPVGSPFTGFLRLGEELRMTKEQTDSLRAMEGRWRQAIDSTQQVLTRYIAQLSDSVSDRDIAAHVQAAQQRAWAVTNAWLPAIRDLLTDAQVEQLPRSLRTYLMSDMPRGADIRSPD